MVLQRRWTELSIETVCVARRDGALPPNVAAIDELMPMCKQHTWVQLELFLAARPGRIVLHSTLQSSTVFPHGGWCPKERLAEDGVIHACYQLLETSTKAYPQRTEWNVRDSDGTVVFTVSDSLTGGSRKTMLLAQKHKKPVVHLPRTGSVMHAANELRGFVEKNGIRVLNVAGSRASKEPEVGLWVQQVLETAWLPSSSSGSDQQSIRRSALDDHGSGVRTLYRCRIERI
jgi:hypothetical protein